MLVLSEHGGSGGSSLTSHLQAGGVIPASALHLLGVCSSAPPCTFSCLLSSPAWDQPQCPPRPLSHAQVKPLDNGFW